MRQIVAAGKEIKRCGHKRIMVSHVHPFPGLSRPQMKTSYPRINLKPGALHVATQPVHLWTILGSCLAVVLYSHKCRTGAMCHAQLPECKQECPMCAETCAAQCTLRTDTDCDAKYVDCSITRMLEGLKQFGAYPKELTAQIYGGANLLRIHDAQHSVGERNVAMAVELIKRYKIPILSLDVGGKLGRTVDFYSDTGVIKVKTTPRQRYTEAQRHDA